ncbi:hypothetical protein DL768_003491 [Monosporascus sp. mg162]|nr:hypothetical protein DL768_003491 [Monosporascus sp. mg162]
MSDIDQDSRSGDQDGIETVNLGMYEAGGEEGSKFTVFNLAADQYHRAEVLQRTGAIDITCNLEKVVHGAMSADGDRYATLIVMRWLFQPKGSRRISEATIELLFGAGSSDGDVEVEKISFLDTYCLMPTIQEETVTQGGDATFGFGQLANFNLTGKWEKAVTTTTSDAITLSGGKRLVRNRPPNRIATWTLSENQTQRTGIPASLKVAVLVSRDDRERFFCTLSFTCKTDVKTAAERLFKKVPKDDPIIFQPNPDVKGTRPNKNVTCGDEDLGSVNLDDLCNVTFRATITNGRKI